MLNGEDLSVDDDLEKESDDDGLMKVHVADEEQVRIPIIELLKDRGVNGLMMKNGYDKLLKNENRDGELMTENDDDELLNVYCKLTATYSIYINLITELFDLDFF
jgi:hypothetical protein